MNSINNYTQQYTMLREFNWREFEGTEADLNQKLNCSNQNGQPIRSYPELSYKIHEAKDLFHLMTGLIILGSSIFVPTLVVGLTNGFNASGIRFIATFLEVGAAAASPFIALGAYSVYKLYQIHHKKLSPIEVSIHKQAAFDRFNDLCKTNREYALEQIKKAEEHLDKAKEYSDLAQGLEKLTYKTRYGTFN